ncbi:hypothetical protein DITRI_Ditri13aG0080100 [Diplodiscus trichospermus]
MEFLQELFIDRDVVEISSIPLVQSDCVDRIVWYFSKDGNYIVKSAYRLLMDRIVSNESLKVDGNWKLLCSLKLPPKVKVFFWRACHDSLPTRTNLQRRGVEVTSWLLTASMSVDCGILLIKLLLIRRASQNGSLKWPALDDGRLGTFTMEVLWDWMRAKRIEGQNVNIEQRQEEVGWQRPPVGYIKCNVEAAWRLIEKLVG